MFSLFNYSFIVQKQVIVPVSKYGQNWKIAKNINIQVETPQYLFFELRVTQISLSVIIFVIHDIFALKVPVCIYYVRTGVVFIR